MASCKIYRESKKVTPEKLTCAYYKKEKEIGLLFPVFTRDLYFSIFQAPIPEGKFNDLNPTDHNAIFKILAHLGSGKIGKHCQAMRKDFAKYPCTRPPRLDPSLAVVLTEIDSRVDYVDAIRAVEPFLMGKPGNPLLCRVLMHFKDRVPYQVEYFYCVSEYWHEGRSLCHLLQQRGRMTEENARFYLAELLCAIEDIHRRGKILRCLSLCMLLISPAGHLKLCPYTMCDQNLDCGKSCDPISKACGDQLYASPEIVFGVDVQPVADWWSFAVVMYQLLTGQVPFTGCTLGELGKAITEQDPAFPEYLSFEALDLVQKLLHKDPRRRLGWGDDGVCAVKNHPFWSSINWLSVPQCCLKPPFKPDDRKT